MPSFSYTAKDSNGQETRGKIDALNLQAAGDALKDMNLIPEEIHETTVNEKVEDWKAPSFGNLEEAKDIQVEEQAKPYFHLADTLRLYAGWLLAGYLAVYFLGFYKLTKPISIDIPYVLAFLYSPLILSFTLACFLFLILTSVNKIIKGRALSGVILTVVGVGVFVFYRANT